jgi:hypothetical protein
VSHVYGLLKKFWDVGVALAVSTAFFLLSFDRMKAQLLAGTLQGLLALGVLVTSVYWLLVFMHATLDELELLHEYKVVEQVGRAGWQTFIAVAVLSLSFGGLVATVTYPILYCAIAVTVQVADCIGMSMTQRAIFLAYRRLPSLNPVLYEYYIYRPHSIHRVAKLLGFMLALVFSVVASFSKQSKFAVASWTLVLLTILTGEYVLVVWRRWRDRELLQSTPIEGR